VLVGAALLATATGCGPEGTKKQTKERPLPADQRPFNYGMLATDGLRSPDHPHAVKIKELLDDMANGRRSTLKQLAVRTKKAASHVPQGFTKISSQTVGPSRRYAVNGSQTMPGYSIVTSCEVDADGMALSVETTTQAGVPGLFEDIHGNELILSRATKPDAPVDTIRLTVSPRAVTDTLPTWPGDPPYDLNKPTDDYEQLQLGAAYQAKVLKLMVDSAPHEQ